MTKHLATGVMGLFMTVLMAMTLSVLYFLFLERAPVEYLKIPFPALAKQVKPGDRVPVQVAICSHAKKPITYIISRSLMEVETQLYTVLGDVTVQLMPGCRTVTSLATAVPTSMAAGRYKIFGLTQVSGTLRMFYVPWSTEEFEVIPP